MGEYKIERTYNNVKFSFSEVKKLDSSGVYITSGSLELAATILVLVATWKILRTADNLLEVRSWSASFTRILAVKRRWQAAR